MTQGQENCLVVWPEDVFMAEAQRAQQTPMTNRGARDYARVLFGGAEQGTPDKQGRIGLSPLLRAYAASTRTWSSSASWTGSRSGIRRSARVQLGGAGEVRRAGREPEHLTQLNSGSVGRGLRPAPLPAGVTSPVPGGTSPGAGMSPRFMEPHRIF